jgi:hypothetical protein
MPWRHITNKRTPWSQSASELYRPSDHRLLAKLVPNFADRVCHVVSVTDPYGLILGFLNRNRYFFFQVAPQLYSWGWVEPVPDPLLLRKCGSAGNRTRTSGSVARNFDHPLDHRGGLSCPCAYITNHYAMKTYMMEWMCRSTFPWPPQ